MKHLLDIDNWNRKEHFNFFKTFDQPYFGVTVKIDCTKAYLRSKTLGVPFFSYYLHKTLLAVNAIENLRYRIESGKVMVYDYIDASATIMREDKSFGFSHIRFDEDFGKFNQITLDEIARVKNTTGLFTMGPLDNIIHFSALPWVDFTGISQASLSTAGDSCPKFSIGKLVEREGRRHMAFNIQVHHALVDGYHVGLFFERLQALMNA
jgi:chloramphenicol O-acetyltransferase type A